MGNASADAVAADGEGPVRRVSLAGFAIAPAAVTNREFGDFVRATRYVTEAERCGESFVFYLQVPAGRRQQARQVAAGLPWWLPVADASWQRPEGPRLAYLRATGPSRGARVVERRDCLLRLGWRAPADRSRMGMRRARRAGGAALRVGRRPHAERGAPVQRLARIVSERARGRLAAGACSRHSRRAQRIWTFQCLRQCLGMVRRLVQPHLPSGDGKRRTRSSAVQQAAGRCGAAHSSATTPTATAIASPPAAPTRRKARRATSAFASRGRQPAASRRGPLTNRYYFEWSRQFYEIAEPTWPERV